MCAFGFIGQRVFQLAAGWVKGNVVATTHRVVLVNCQLVGGAHEGEPGFTLTLLKAVCSTSGSNWQGALGARAVMDRFLSADWPSDWSRYRTGG